MERDFMKVTGMFSLILVVQKMNVVTTMTCSHSAVVPVYCTAIVWEQIYGLINSESVQLSILFLYSGLG